MTDYMREYGPRLQRQGFDVIPIRRGGKNPSIDDWRTIASSAQQIEQWCANGRGNHGVGIRTKTAPLVDLDCRDGNYNKEFLARSYDITGFAPIRIGAAPKLGIGFRSDVPFRKITSPEFVDDKGRKAQLEILGDGQQYVAYHTHPDTGRPYRWIDGEGPLNWPLAKWPSLSEEQGRWLVDLFVTMCEERGWQRKRRLASQVLTVSDDDDPFDIASAPTDLSDVRLREMVEAIPNDSVIYDDWYMMLMAIHHQTGGSEVGREIALEWSEKSGKHNSDPRDPDKFNKTWNSLHENPEGRRPITARYIIKIYRETVTEENELIVEDILDRMKAADSLKGLQTIAKEATKLDLNPMVKGTIVDALQKNYTRLTGAKLPIRDARQMVRYQRTSGDTPKWLENWMFLAQPNRFFNRNTKQLILKEAFDSMYGYHVFVGEKASEYALNSVKIDRADLAMYLPTADEIFMREGLRCVNTYSTSGIPEVPTTLTRADVRNVEIVEAHFRHLFPDDRDARMFASWLAYIVQTNERPNWAMVLQGVEGDGKSWFTYLMAAVLGPDNVSTIFANTLESPHNEWAQGHQLACIEEMRMQGHNRFDALNRIKPLITNAAIEIHPKGLPAYNCPNTQAYIVTTNYGNALPLTMSDSRYYVAMSQWQTKDAIDQFKRENPQYYTDLYASFRESPGAIRDWFLHYALHPEFDALGRAPDSLGRQKMIEASKPEQAEIIRELVEDGKHPRISEEILVVSDLLEALYDDGEIPNTGHGLRITLEAEGFHRIGRIKIDGKAESVWSKNPQKYSGNQLDRNSRVKKYLKWAASTDL